MIAALIFALAVASQSLVSVHSASVDQVDAKAVCDGKSVSISNIDQFRSLAKQLDEGVECPENTKKAVFALKEFIVRNGRDVCNMNHTAQILEFVESFESLPESIELFAKSYFVQVSRACKIYMIDLITNEADQTLTDNDYKTVETLTSKGGSTGSEAVKRIISSELMLPTYFAIIYAQTAGQNLQTHVDPARVADVENLIRVCKQKFSPIYESILVPIVELASIGMDYPDSKVIQQVNISEEQRNKLNSANVVVWACGMAGLADRTHPELAKDVKELNVEYEPKAKIVVDGFDHLSNEQFDELRKTSVTEQQAKDQRFYDAMVEAIREKGNPDEIEALEEMTMCERKTPVVTEEDGLEVASDKLKTNTCGRGVGLVLYAVLISVSVMGMSILGGD